jgi:hypothetical protein
MVYNGAVLLLRRGPPGVVVREVMESGAHRDKELVIGLKGS